MPNTEFYIEEPKRSFGKIIALFFALAIVVALTVGAYFYTKVNQAASSESVPVNFTVTKGESTKTIARSLSDQSIISSYWSFILYVKVHDASNKIQAGNYNLDRNMNISDIVDVLTHGRVVSDTRTITIIEGLSNKQIAKLFLDRQITTSLTGLDEALGKQGTGFKFFDEAKRFAFQGFLFPDTYTLKHDATATDLVAKMLANFESKFTDKMVSDAKAQNHSMDEVVILASIIEKEVGRNKTELTAGDIATMQHERELVASVFYNRLEIGMPLESDATVNYITGKSDRSATIADTKIKNPYNTYQNRGLPPTPISNPGLGSLLAAVNPAKSDYLYFLNAPDGTAYFAKTLAEHNANRAKYLR
jgi:UPF0755 protein